MSGNGSLMSIEKLNGRENWTSWSFAVKAYLQHEDLYDCILSAPTDETTRKQDVKAKSKLILLIDPILYVHIQNAENAKQVWENLAKAFEDSGLTRKVGLLKELINTNLETSSSIEDYVNKIMTAAHKLRNIKFNVNDEWLGTLMLAGLPDMYKPMIMALESSGMKISADLVKNKLIQEVKSSDTTALYTNSKSNQNQFKTDQQKVQKGPRCFNCNKYGHLGKNCWYKKNKSTKNENKTGFVAAFSGCSTNDSVNWYVDSGASMHMTMHRDWLNNVQAPPVSNIRIADNKVLKVECCGNITIKALDTQGKFNKILVRNVIFVPELSTNLISVSQMIKSGCKVEFNANGCQILNQRGEKVAKANLINDMYKLDVINHDEAHAMSAVTKNDIHIWHQRMGHLNFTDLNKLPFYTTGVQLPPAKENITCISCIEGKQTRQSFPNEGSRATELLEVIHSDIVGPMQTTTHGGARYFVTFIDDFSRKVFVYPIKNKSEALEKFIEYKNRVENELNRKIKKLRTDNGREYVNQSFDNYLKKYGILHQTTNPYTPEQNGLSERMNRTLIERSKCMLFNAQLQNSYWGEAVVTAAHIINRSPTKALSDITPEEMWTGTKPDLSHLRVFGCRAMVHIPKERRLKLDPKSRELIFVGYNDGVKGYRFIDPKTKQAVVSRDVIFLEATVNKKIIDESAPVKEKENIKYKTTQSIIKDNKYKENLPLQRNINVPLSQTDANEEEIHSNDDNGNSTARNVSQNSSTSSYSDPDDETYVPAESIILDDETAETYRRNINLRPRRRDEIYVNTDSNEGTESSFLCMNGETAMGILDQDPQNLSEALHSQRADKWIEAMQEEYKSLLLNNTWTLVDAPENKKVIPCKWVYKTKTDEKGNITRYKARLVLKGYQQKKGIDYHEIYAPVVRYSSIRYVFGLSVKYNLKVHQLDAVTAFLQGDIDEDIYMSQPPSFEEGNKVCKLNKSIYGLKQASRQWNKKLNTILLDIGMTRSRVDPCIYYRIIDEKDILFLTVYVDDILCFFNSDNTILMLKKKLNEKFYIKDLGEAKCCVGFKISQTKNDEISLDQSLYIEKILTRFNMIDCNPALTPCEPNLQLKKAENEGELLKNVPYHELIGCLLYLSQCTRPDISYIVNQLSQFNNEPTSQHWTAAKRVLRYLKGTQNLKLTFKKNNSNMVGYSDSDWATDKDRRSRSGYVFIFQGAAISWCSKKQPTIALSTTEAEYMALATAIQEAIWLNQLQQDFWPALLSGIPIIMNCDNQSAISLSGNDLYHARSKHIDVRYHFIREKISVNQVAVRYISTQEMVADVLTKGLPRPKHQMFTEAMGLRPGTDDGI